MIKLIQKLRMKLLFLFLFLFLLSNAQQTKSNKIIQRIDPPNWFTGMVDTTLELMIKINPGESYSLTSKSDKIKVLANELSENKNYLYALLAIQKDIKTGLYEFEIKNEKNNVIEKFNYQLKNKNNHQTKGINTDDFIYLIFPDRFCNGDLKNDVVKGMNQESLSRDSMFLRHGGDLQGINSKIAYVKSLGATAIWINPIQENNQPKESYHGYAITDHYKVDPRFGSMEDYLLLSNNLHKEGMKVIMDIIPNHCGNEHYFIKDLPSKDWIHHWDNFTRTSYRAATVMDLHASNYDKKIFADGWFDKHMPDINQKNVHYQKYFIQNCIWWAATAGLDGFRIDTYAYPDKDFLINWIKSVRKEFPQIGIFGEIWDHSVPIQSYFQNYASKKGIENPPGITDFMVNFALIDAINKESGWTEGTSRLYYVLAQDYLYEKPEANVIFLDNHDISRIYSMLGEDKEKLKMAIGFLLTARGIPMLYYGTEILLKNFADPDGKVRQDFPGGWPNDKVNKFEDSGRSNDEKDIYNYLSKLGNYRKSSKALTIGSYIHYVPEKGVYVYARIHDEEQFLILFNPSNKAIDLNTNKFSEIIQNKKIIKDIITDETMELKETITANPKTITIFELK